MATKTATCGAATWKYVDRFGIPHTITTNQTFTVDVTDVSATVVKYTFLGSTLTTTDGLKVKILKDSDGGNVARYAILRDAYQNGTVDYRAPGNMLCVCPVSGIIQRWKLAKIDVDDVDSPGTLTAITFEDQFGNVMKMAGPTVA
jgi:hypothetical protein